MSGPGGSSTGTDNAAVAAAALRGAALAFGRQKNAEQQAHKTQPPHLQLPNSDRPRRQPSLSPSRNSANSSGHSTSALLAATSAAASSSRDSTHPGRGGSSGLRPVSPSKLSSTSGSGNRSRSHSTSNSRSSSILSRSRSRDRNTRDDTADFDSMIPPARLILPQPAVERMQTGGVRAVAPPYNVRQSSFLAATRAASQATSPRVTPSHTGGGNTAAAPIPTHLSAALWASAASDKRQRAAKAATAATLAAAAAASTENMIRHGIYLDGRAPLYDRDGEERANVPDTMASPATSSLVSVFEGKNETAARSPARPPRQIAFTPPRSLSPRHKSAVLAMPPAKTPARMLIDLPTALPTKDTTTIPSTAESPDTPPAETANAKQDSESQPRPAAAPSVISYSPNRKDKLENVSTNSSNHKNHQISSRDFHADADVMDRPAPPRPRLHKPSATHIRSLAKDGDLTQDGSSRATSSVGRGPLPSVPPRQSATALTARHTGDAPSTATGIDGLASAIMAGSLAAARHPTTSSAPLKMRTLSLSLPSSRSHTPLTHSTRSISPVKRTAMLQTLRRERVHSDDDDYDRDGTSSGNTQYRRSHYHRDGRLRQGKHHLLHATPAALVGGGRHRHKHHEGARRRWREAVSDRQRRRYEAVWASNRGSRGFKSVDGKDFDANAAVASDDDDTVPNVVVRDLWRRSRLPMDELAEVWELVDETGNGRLSKAGFVVGMWLIDQRLRGRKIPARVSESVWTSARGMQAPKPRKR
ncbi:Increased rDNA silencing protein [Sporothrix epigloea]|uniref:Increased rDNA silencing protein n=1 Tax=Sporothrix epigloea TaxID=1892477 RepID=A0ABP0DG06_9PEZI